MTAPERVQVAEPPPATEPAALEAAALGEAPTAEPETAGEPVAEPARRLAPSPVSGAEDEGESSVDAVRERTRALLERYGGERERP